MILKVSVNNFSVMLGRGHRFLGITSTFWGVNVPCSRTQHGLTRVGLEPPTSGSGVRGINHQATALPYLPFVCLDDIYLDIGSRVATLWQKAAHLVNRMFSLLCLFVVLVVSLSFEGGTLILIASVSQFLVINFLLLFIFICYFTPRST